MATLNLLETSKKCAVVRNLVFPNPPGCADSFVMEFNFRSVGKVSHFEGKAFMPEDKVVSFLYRAGTEGIIERMDIHAEDEGKVSPEGPVICRWTHRIREEAQTEAELRKQQMQSSEDLFLALCQENQDAEKEMLPETQTLMALLALQLERKRIVRSVGSGIYLHVKTKVRYRVPNVEFDPQKLMEIQDQLQQLL